MSHRARILPTLAVLIALFALVGCDPDPDELTPPGTELEFGETARVTRSEGSGTIAVTVVEITRGDPADLEEVGYDSAENQTPYYLRVKVTLEEGEDPIDLKDYLKVFAGDAPLTPLTILDDFAPCPGLPVSVDEPGEAQDACFTYGNDEGDPTPDTVYFDNDDDYNAFDGNAVSWK